MNTRILILAIALIGITSACNAGKPAKTKKATSISIVGTWSHDDGDDTDYYQFNADGTGLEWDVDKNAPKNYQPRKKSFKYQIKNGRIIFIENDGDIDNEGLRIKNNKTIQIDHDTYHRVK